MMLSDDTILLVEDDPNDILLIQRAFYKANVKHPVQVLKDGEEAVLYLGGKQMYADRDRYPLPALLLLDLKMPRRSGFEVMEWLQHQSDIELPVVILTSSTDPSEMQRAYQLGAKSYILKPLTLDMLLPLLKFAEISP